MRALYAIALVLPVFALGAVWQASRADQPALIGYGCEGTSGPIYADEEDQFPICENIERNR